MPRLVLQTDDHETVAVLKPSWEALARLHRDLCLLAKESPDYPDTWHRDNLQMLSALLGLLQTAPQTLDWTPLEWEPLDPAVDDTNA